MDDYLNLPFSELGPSDEAEPGTVGAATPRFNLPEAKNYADDESVKRQIEETVFSLISQARQNRTPLDEEWRQIRRMEKMMHDNSRRYIGRSNAYLPIWAKASQNLVSGISSGLFPSDEYMDVVDRSTLNPEAAKPTKAYLQWEFEDVAKLRTRIKPFIKQHVNFGNSPIKYWYSKQVRQEGRQATVKDIQKILRGEPTFRPTILNEGLRISPRSIFYWYMWPITAESLDDATIVFEDIDTPLGYIQEMGAKKRWINIEQALSVAAPNEHRANQVDQISGPYGVTPTMPSTESPLGTVRVLTEAWTYLRLPKGAYTDGENPNEPIPVRIVLAGNAILEVTRNPYWHQRPPYVISRTNVDPGFFYGYGAGRLVRPAQFLANDFANQTNDCGNYLLNPAIKANIGKIAGPLPNLRPGVTFPVTDMDALDFMRPPFEMLQNGMSMLREYTSMGQDWAGAPPVLQGTGGAKTATSTSILQRNALSPIQDDVRDIEESVLVPLMYGAWLNAQQFREEDVMVRVAGQSIKVAMADLAIDPEMRWLASSQAQNQAQRALGLTQLVQAMLPSVQVLNQLGYIFDPAPLFERIATDGLGIRGFDRVLYKAQAAPGAQPPGSPAMGGVQQEQQDRLRSALDQVSMRGVGEPAEMQPGEGEDFADIRKQSDALAATMGRTYGQ